MYTVYIVGIILPGIDLVSNRLIIDAFGFRFATLGSQEKDHVLMIIVR